MFLLLFFFFFFFNVNISSLKLIRRIFIEIPVCALCVLQTLLREEEFAKVCRAQRPRREIPNFTAVMYFQRKRLEHRGTPLERDFIPLRDLNTFS